MSILVKKDPDIIKAYLEDSSNLKGGHADEVVLPANIEELSAFVREANLKKIPITISGAGTGTTGARVPFGGAVISMERFNRILDVSEERMSCVLQPGVMVDDLKRACEAKGLFYTSHPTEPTASLGGTVATNASGSRSFKYGPTRRYIKRLVMVLPSGEVIEIERGKKILICHDSEVKLASGHVIKVPLPGYKMPAVKNSAGYFAVEGMDLIDLFIGQEGTLSVITEIELGLVKEPPRIFSCFVFFEREIDAWEFSAAAKRSSKTGRPGGGPEPDLLSIEYFDANALKMLMMKDPNVPPGMNAAIFFEEEISAETEGRALERWLGLIAGHHASMDNTWVAMNKKEAGRFTELRHHIPEAINDTVRRRSFRKFSTDIAVPEDKFSEMMRFYTDTFRESDIEHVIFGHIGECHAHVNLLPGSGAELRTAREIALSFIKKGVSLGGTISAEHGVGKTKHRYLEIMYGPDGILDMARIKKAFDPNCILGLDNIFPKELLGTL